MFIFVKNKHKQRTRVSALKVRHQSTSITLFLSRHNEHIQDHNLVVPHEHFVLTSLSLYFGNYDTHSLVIDLIHGGDIYGLSFK